MWNANRVLYIFFVYVSQIFRNSQLIGVRALKAYVTAKDGTEYDRLDKSLVSVHITHNHLRQRMLNIRLELRASVRLHYVALYVAVLAHNNSSFASTDSRNKGKTLQTLWYQA